MKSLFFSAFCVLGATLALTPAQAAYNPAIVGADARWVVHADLNGLRASTLGAELISALEKAQAESTQGAFGLNFQKVLMTVGTLTAYGSNLAKDPAAIDGVLIAQGTSDLGKIAESILLQGTFAQPDSITEVTDLPFPAYAINDPKAPPATRMQLIVAFPPEPIVLLSKSRAQIVKARDVFRGAERSLTKVPGSPLTALAAKAAGAYLFAASVVPTDSLFPQNAPQARVLQLANSGALAFGEEGENTFIFTELKASSTQNAEKLLKIVQGMTAMLSLAETNDRQLAEFLNATVAAREGDVVTMRLAYPSARLVQMSQMLRTPASAKPSANRQQAITSGKPVAEWSAQADTSNPDENGVHWRVIENVPLRNGDSVTVGRALNGGDGARFERVEIIPADGAGSPLVFSTEMMRSIRGTMWQVPFPGADGRYTLKVAYRPDRERKAMFAVSVGNLRPTPPTAPTPPSK